MEMENRTALSPPRHIGTLLCKTIGEKIIHRQIMFLTSTLDEFCRISIFPCYNVGNCQGSRRWRSSHRFASSSPMNFQFSGSHWSFRPCQ